MNPIRLPRAAAKLKAFAETVTTSHDRAIELRQDETAAIVTAADGHQLCRITAPPPAGTTPGKVEPFLVDARTFSKAAGEVGCGRTTPLVSSGPDHVAPEDRPLVVVKVDDKTVGVAGPEGTPQTITPMAGRMPDCVRIVDGIRHDAATGGTKAVARLDPRFLQNVADTAVAAGLATIEITFSSKLNFIMAEGVAPDGCKVEFAIAGIGEIDFEEIKARPLEPWEADDALTFTMPEAKPRKSVKRTKKAQDLELPFDDIPF
jgi:hypothetical protein